MKSVDWLVCVCLAWPTNGCGCRTCSLDQRTGTEKPNIGYSGRLQSGVGRGESVLEGGLGRDLEVVHSRQTGLSQDETWKQPSKNRSSGEEREDKETGKQ
jgi:hypothetical protein